MDPELEQHESLFGKHPLVVADRFQSQLELLRVDTAGNPRDEYFVVPSVHEDADATPRGQRAPISPWQQMYGLVAAAGTERDDADVARIHPFRELVGGLAAAASFYAGNDQQHGSVARLAELPLRVEERLTELRLLALVLRLRYPMTDFGGFEHRVPYVRA